MTNIETLLDDEKEIAIKFLKKMFDNKNNLQLSEIKKGLELDFIIRHIDNIRLNDISENRPVKILNNVCQDNDGKNFKKKRKVYDIDMDLFSKLVLDIVPENNEGIGIQKIIEYVNNNMKTKLPRIVIYNRLITLKKGNIINSYSLKNKLFWFVNKNRDIKIIPFQPTS
jgi:hypothetical protein